MCVLAACPIALASGCGARTERADLGTEPSSPPSRCALQPELPASWTLRNDTIQVDIQRSPYTLSVRDADGRIALKSALSSDAGADGYGTLSFTTGSVEYQRLEGILSGYTKFSAALDPWRGSFQVVAADRSPSKLTLRLTSGTGERERCLTIIHQLRKATLRFEARVHGEPPRAWAAAFRTPKDEGFVGFGERFNRTNQRGGDVWSWAEEGGIGAGEGQPPSATNPFPHGEMMSYYPVPFFLSTEGYGFWLDTTYRSEFNLATERPDAWRVWHVGPELAYEVYVGRPDDPRPWPYHIIDAFTERTGRPMLPPSWAFGPRRRVNPGDKVGTQSEIEHMREQDLALTAVDDAMHFYPTGSHLGFEDELAAWTRRARALGLRVNGYYNSFVDQASDSPLAEWAQEGLANGYFLQRKDGTYPNISLLTGGRSVVLYLVDFTKPKATAWYQSSFDWALSLGYTGWMYDFGEYVPADVVAHDGTPGEALHNAYPVIYAKAVFEALERGPHQGDWLAFMRSGYTGASQYAPMVWLGDPAASFEASDGLPSMLAAGLNLGISGVPHVGGDIGGFHCLTDGWQAADEELLTRWIQQASMTSNMQDQDACVGSDKQKKASLWSAPEARAAWHTYARLHTRLFPYLYALAHQAHATGAPLMRQLFLEHPDRKELVGVQDAYYFGPSLLVAPVLERGARQRTAMLPDALYLDWSTRELIRGGDDVRLEAPLAHLPLLLRANHLLPLLDPRIDTLADESDPNVVGPADVAEVYDVVGLLTPGARARFTLHGGARLQASYGDRVTAPVLSKAANEEELASCNACYLLQELTSASRTLVRLRASSDRPRVSAGGLVLESNVSRRIRWDLYLAAEP